MQEKLVRKSSQRGNKELNSSLKKTLQLWPKLTFRLKKYLKCFKKTNKHRNTILVSEYLGLNPNP